MDELSGCLVGLVGIVVVVAVFGLGALLLTSHAVLYKEQALDGGYFYCTYFTGTRSVEMYSTASSGCARFIEVGK